MFLHELNPSASRMNLHPSRITSEALMLHRIGSAPLLLQQRAIGLRWEYSWSARATIDELATALRRVSCGATPHISCAGLNVAF